MHPEIFQEFDRICANHDIHGRALEIGATPDDSTLLNLPSLMGVDEKIGIDLSGASTFRDISIRAMDAHDMHDFPDRHFDVVICNSVLEHDPFFWLTLAEIRRVAKPGALIVMGAPGFGQYRREKWFRRLLAKLPRIMCPSGGWAMQHSTLTLGLHNYPGDYYRFTEQAFRDVIFAGMKDVYVFSVLNPPRIIGYGSMP